jgi:peptidylprolyl isomerase
VIAAALLALVLAEAAAPPAAPAAAPPAPAPTPAGPPVPDWKPLDPANTIVMDTTKGRVIIELRPDIAPLAAARIKVLARQGYYDGALFYRVLKGFMAQGGDKGDKQYTSKLPNLKAEFTFRRTPTLAFTSVGTTPMGEVGFVGSLPVMIDAPAEGANPATPPRGWTYFCSGVMSMPHGNNPDSANSQIFLLRSNAHAFNLEKTFTALGRIVSGQGAVDAMNDGFPPPNPDKMTKVRVLADIPAAQRPKIQVMNTAGPAFAALAAEALKKPNATLCDIQVPVQEG